MNATHSTFCRSLSSCCRRRIFRELLQRPRRTHPWLLPAFVLVAVWLLITPGFASSYRTLISPVGAAAGDYFGFPVSTAGDVNGDGYPDMIVGASGNDEGGLDCGSAYVYYGGPVLDAAADLTFIGEAADGHFGYSVSTAGDLNGDGYPDLIVGAHGANHAYVYYGGVVPDTTADLTLTGSGHFGVSVSVAGDVNSDGYSDVIVGAHMARKAYVYYGGTTPDATADLILDEGSGATFFGYSVSTAGDVNGDGYDDMIVGAGGSHSFRGTAYIYYGGAAPDPNADLILIGAGESAEDRFGGSVSTAGDVNGDGYDDVIVGAKQYGVSPHGPGHAYVYYGGAAPDTTADLIFTGESFGDCLGGSVSEAGDLNGDGYEDLIVGAHDEAGTGPGRAYIYFGGPAADADPDFAMIGEGAGDRFGVAVSPLGDMNLNGSGDVAVGAYFNDEAGENAGKAYVFEFAGDVTPNAAGFCISTANPCVTVPMIFTRVDSADARGISVTFALSPELELCGSITQGAWLAGFASTFQVIDNGGGSYTVDQAILGQPCGVTTGGTLFEIPVGKTAGVTTDSTGTITVTAVAARDCANQPLPGVPGDAASIPIDITLPATITDLAASQKKSGNDSDGTTEIIITFTAPGDADSVRVFRMGFGDYPEYDDGTGAAPAAPATPGDAITDGWTLTDVTATGQTDEPATRDFWYYVAFTEDACDNVSAVSNLTSGTLNYHLGDVTDGTTPGNGDNAVNGLDVSLLGANYGIMLTYGAAFNYLDVGPTTDYSVNGRPTTDDSIGFEDLMMFAINYGQVSLRGAPGIAREPSDAAERPALVLTSRQGDRLTTRLLLRDNEASVKGFHAVVKFDPQALELESAVRGELLSAAGGAVFFAAVEDEGEIAVDAAALGRDLALAGSGEVAVLTFTVEEDEARPALTLAELRDRDNLPLGDPPTAEAAQLSSSEPPAHSALPTKLELLGARPNPFTHTTDIVFRLPQATDVSVRVYDVTGRLVRTLLARTLPAGEHRAVWDGTSEEGHLAGAGVYFYTFQAGSARETHKLLHVQ